MSTYLEYKVSIEDVRISSEGDKALLIHESGSVLHTFLVCLGLDP